MRNKTITLKANGNNYVVSYDAITNEIADTQFDYDPDLKVELMQQLYDKVKGE